MISSQGSNAVSTPASEGRLRVEVASTRDRWLAVRADWNALVERSPAPSPMLSHEWITAFVDDFAPRRRLHCSLVYRGATLVGGAALAWERRWFHGLPYVTLASLSNEHSQRFDLLADGPDALGALWSHLRSVPGWDLLELKDVPSGGAGEDLARLAARDGWPVGRWESMRTPFVPLGEAPRIGAKLRQNLRRRRRKLEEVGSVRLEENGGGDGLDELLEEGFALEASGWKGKAGTAIACEPSTRGFYRELARAAARRGWLALYGLRAGDRLVAFHFGLRHRGRYFLPKPAYDETLGACSPGQLLVEAVLERCRESSLAEFDFLGPSMPWKRDWTEAERPHAWQLVFGDTTAGRALRFAKLELAPAARSSLSRLTERIPWKR